MRLGKLAFTGSVMLAAILISALLLFGSFYTASAQELSQAEQDRVQFCQDSVHYYYFSRTGIELDFDVTNYVDDDTPIVGVASSDDERFTGPVYFRCIYGEVEGVEVIVEIEVKP
jgi:hypothetical protein